MLTDKNAKHEILQSPVPVLLFFTSEACAPSYAMEMVLEDAFDEIDKLARTMVVDIENCPATTRELQIKGTPTLMVVSHHNGEVIASRIGTQTEEQLLEWLKESTAKIGVDA